MNAQLAFDTPPRARTGDPVTSHEAAERVRPGNSALVTEIRTCVAAWVRAWNAPIDAFQIAHMVEHRNPGRWSDASVRTAVARSGLTAIDTQGKSPRGQRCLRYVLDAS